MRWEAVTDADRELLTRELGRPPRGLLAVAYRCEHGVPAVVQTAPRLPDGTPFPTMFYLCCSALNAAVSRMESVGVMREMTAELAADPDLAEQYRAAHESYLRMRNQLDDLGIAVDRRRHAGPGEVPARPGRSFPGGRSRGQPVR